MSTFCARAVTTSVTKTCFVGRAELQLVALQQLRFRLQLQGQPQQA